MFQLWVKIQLSQTYNIEICCCSTCVLRQNSRYIRRSGGSPLLKRSHAICYPKFNVWPRVLRLHHLLMACCSSLLNFTDIQIITITTSKTKTYIWGHRRWSVNPYISSSASSETTRSLDLSVLSSKFDVLGLCRQTPIS